MHSRTPVHPLRFCPRCRVKQAAFNKVQSRVRRFGGVFSFTVVNEALALAHCSSSAVYGHPSLHPVQACMALFESGDDDYIFIFFVKSCKVRTTAAAAAARSAFAARCATCVALLRTRAGAHACPCSRPLLTCMLTVLFACTRLAPRPRSIEAIIVCVLLARSLFCRS